MSTNNPRSPVVLSAGPVTDDSSMTPAERSLPDRSTLAPYGITIVAIFCVSILVAGILSLLVDMSAISGRVITDPTALRENLVGIQSVTFFVNVILNNALIALMVVMSAVFRKKFIPHLFIFWNGFVITIYSITIIQAIGGMQFVSAFMPHAIIELPTLLIAAVYATYAIDQFQAESATWHVDRESARWYLLLPYLYRIVPFVVVAAAVETFISLPLLKLVVGV